ncbi:MAG: hypothetical protein NC122_00185 [Faecalibacterium sp.]|nr:hypothetical protein [Ruminococcus sp.]MCM1391398.1 hypothetical protein [Ruminococcus sp.]MCM1484608.1 hypothetical protein [Faecalibacterium sp.]
MLFAKIFYIVCLYGFLFYINYHWKDDGITLIKVSPKVFTPICFFCFKQDNKYRKTKYAKVELGVVIVEVFCYVLSLAAIIDSIAFENRYFAMKNIAIDAFWLSTVIFAFVYDVICEIKKKVNRNK